MKELFDVHCHMVPGVDDGAADLEESLAMLKMQHEDGVRKIIITPHYRRRMFETPAKKVHEQFLKLQEAAKRNIRICRFISGVNFTRTWIFRISWKNGNM